MLQKPGNVEVEVGPNGDERVRCRLSARDQFARHWVRASAIQVHIIAALAAMVAKGPAVLLAAVAIESRRLVRPVRVLDQLQHVLVPLVAFLRRRAARGLSRLQAAREMEGIIDRGALECAQFVRAVKLPEPLADRRHFVLLSHTDAKPGRLRLLQRTINEGRSEN